MGSVKQENVQVNVEINGQKAGKTLAELKKDSQQLYRELSQLKPGTDAFIKKMEEIKKVEKQLKSVRDQIKGIGDEMKKTSSGFMGGLKNLKGEFDGLTNSFGPIGGMIAAIFSIGVIIGFVQSVFEVTAAFQKYEAVLTNTLGSQQLAKMAMQEIKEIAASTPFSVDELTESYVKLRNQGIKPTREEIIAMGDLAASQGKSFDQLTEAMLDAQSGEFERLKEFGVKAKKEGDKIMLTFKGQTQEVKNTSDAINNYILGLGKLEGVAGGMAAQSATLGGQLSNLGDTFDNLFATIGSGTGGIMSKALSMLSDYVSWVTEALMTTQQINDKVISMQAKKFIAEFDAADAKAKDRLIAITRGRLDALKNMVATGREWNEVTQAWNGDKLTDEEMERLTLERDYYQTRMDYIISYGKESNDKLRKQFIEETKRLEEEAKKKEELAKKEAERLKKLAEQTAKDNADARKKIKDMELALIDDEQTRKIAILNEQAAREREAVNKTLADAILKEQELILIEKNLSKNILEVQKDFYEKADKLRKEQLEKEKELGNRSKTAKADLAVIGASGNDDALLQASLDRLDVLKEIELQNTNLLEEEKWLITAKYEAQKDELREQYANKEADRQRQMLESANSLVQGGLQAISDFNALSFEKDVAAAESARDRKLAILKGEYNEKILNEQQYEDAKAAAQQQYDQKARRIKRQQAQADKEAKLLEATIATFAAVAKALPNIPLSILAGVTGATQIAKIASTKLPEYSRGGTLGGIPDGPGHDQGGISLVNSQTGQKVGEMEGGEPYMILSRNTMKNNGEIINKLLDSSLYRNGAKIYQDGGVFNGQKPTPSGGAADPNTQVMISYLASIDQKVGNFPTLLRSYVVLNDINEAQALDDQINKEAGFN